jgi:nucleoside-diphosphate-sugar epimerase
VKVAVIGASGFVGGHILRVLRAGGDDARAVVRNPQFSPRDPNRRIADAGNVYAIRDAIAGCDCLVHSVLGPAEVILGSLAPVYAAAEAVGVRRIVYMSTGSVHGQSPKPGTDETTPLSVRQAFAYNNAKVRAERKLRRLRARGTVEVVMLRPTIVFGPGSRWVRDFATALRNNTACVVDGGRGICNSIYVDNLAHAVRLALTVPGIDGEVFLVGDEETVTWRDLYRPIAAALGYDFDSVPSVDFPEVKPGFKQLYIQPIRTSEPGQAVLTRFPPGLKTTLRRAVRLVRRSTAGAGGGTVSAVSQTAPQISAEMAALHRCRWRLPHDKAVRLLGYAPPVSFAEGCRRSVEWLQDLPVSKSSLDPGDSSHVVSA